MVRKQLAADGCTLLNIDLSVDRLKARLVAKGYT